MNAQPRPENFLRRHAMRVRDDPVATLVRHFQFNANWRKLFGDLGQIFLTKTVLALNQNSYQRDLCILNSPLLSQSLLCPHEKPIPGLSQKKGRQVLR